MLRRATSSLLPAAVLAVLVYEIATTPFYSAGELATAREKSVAMADAGDIDGAIERFKALIDIAPRDTAVWADYITVLIRAGRIDEALTIERDHLQRDDAPVYVLDALFDVALARGDAANALVLAQAGLKRSEQPVDYALLKSVRLEEKTWLGEATALVDTALQHNPGDQRLRARWLSLTVDTDPAAHLRELRELTLAQPMEADIQRAYHRAIIERARQGDYPLALAELQPLYQREPQHAALAADYLTVLSWAGQHPEALVVFDATDAAALPLYARRAAADSLRLEARLDEAEQQYRLLQADEPDWSAIGLAQVALARQQPETAINLLEPLVAEPARATADSSGAAKTEGKTAPDADQLTALQVLAQAYAAACRAADAAHSAGRAFALQPATARNYLFWYDQMEYAVAVDGLAPHLSSLERWLPGAASEDIQARYAVLLVSHGEGARADAVIVQGLRTPRLAQQFAWEASAARDSGDTATSILLYDYALKWFPQDRELRLGLALSHSRRGDRRQADARFAGLLHDFPNDLAVQDGAIYHYRRSGQHAQAMAVIEQRLPQVDRRDRLIDSYVALAMADDNLLTDAERLQAIERVQRYAPQHPALLRSKADLLVRMQRCEEAGQALAAMPLAQLSAGALEGAGYLARQCRQFELAQSIYREGQRRYPRQGVFIAGQANVLVDQGDTEQALTLLAQQPLNSADLLAAHIYACEQRAEEEPSRREDYSAAALRSSGKLLALRPDDQTLLVRHALRLSAVGRNEEAMRLANAQPQAFSIQDWQHLRADEAAWLIRRAQQDGRSAAEKSALIATALQKLDDYEAFLRRALPQRRDLQLTARHDRIAAHYTAADYAAVIATFEALPADAHSQTPVTVYEQVGDAYLYRQRSADAIALLEGARAAGVDSPAIQKTLYYAYLDAGELERAQTYLAQLNAAPPAGTQAQAPWSEREAAVLLAYRGDLDRAQAQMDELAQQYPDDTSVAMQQARIARWQGEPRRAQKHYADVVASEPDNIDAQVGEAYALLDSRDLPAAAQRVQQLSDNNADEPAVQSLREDWALHNSYELDSRVQWGSASGDTYGNEDFFFDTRLYSKPMADSFRAFAHYYDTWAELPPGEGTGKLRRAGVGAEYRSRDVGGSAEVHHGLSEGSDDGVTLSGEWRPDDHFSLAGTVQTESTAVPLRAIADGVDGESAELALRYRWQASHHASVSLQNVRFSDDNERLALFASHYHRVYTDEWHSVALIEQFYTSTNSADTNRLYFNPGSDLSAGLAVEYQGTLSASAERRWSHRLTTGIAAYRQEDFGSEPIWDIDYEQRWGLGNRLALYYGALYRQRSYDGDGESYTALYGGINWRFD